MEAHVTRVRGRASRIERVQIDAATGTLSSLEQGDTLEIVGPAESRLLASGGPDRFSVLSIVGPDDFRDLVGDPTAEGEVELVLGGQLTPWPRRLCASLEQAVLAVEAWLENGGPDPRFDWQQQGSVLDSH